MADYLVTDTELTSIADAIRTKGGTSASLAFPTGFVNAIDAIPSGGGGLPGWTDITSAFTLDGSYDYFQALYRAQSDTVVFFGQCGIDGTAPSVSTITPSGNYVPDVATLYAMDAGMQPMGTITAVNLHVSTSTVYDFFPFTEDLVWDLTQNSTPLDDTPEVCFYCMYIVNA